MKKKRSGKQYLVCDEYDHSRPFNTRTEAVRECAIWRKEGRNAEVIRRIPEHLAARPAAIIPRFYGRSAEQVFNHTQEVGDGLLRWWERDTEYWGAPTYEQPKLRGWLEREPELLNSDPRFMSEEDWEDAPIVDLAMSPQELWMEHRGWSA